MPKIKSHSGTKKRLSVTKNGKIKMPRTNRGHDIKGCKSPKRKRQLRKAAYADSTLVAQIRRLIPYK